MTEKLRAYLDGLFEAVPDTQEVREAKDELYDGMVERYEDCLREGMDEQAAYDCVVDSIGDIRELIDELDVGQAAADDGQAGGQQAKSGFDVNEFVKNVADFTTNLVSGVTDEINDWLNEPKWGELRLVNSIKLPLEGVNSISLDYVSDAIRLAVGTTDELVVNEYMTRDDESLKAEVRATGGSIEIRHGRRLGFFLARSRIEVLLPAGWDGALSITNISGRISSADVWKLGSLAAKTVSGDVDFAGVSAGQVRLSSTSGAVRLGDAEGALEAHTVSGSIRADAVRGSGIFSTTSGGIRVSFEELRGDVKASSISGGIRLAIPEGTGVELELSSTSGTIHTAYNDGLSYQKRNQVHATIGAEPRHYVRAFTTSGGIHIND